MGRSSYTRRQVCQLGLSSFAGLTLLDLAACGSSTSTASTNETMQLSFWGDASRNKLTKNAIKAFQQDGHTNITIDSWFADFSSYFNKLNTQIAGGTSPDLIQMDMSYVQQYVKNHILLDMTSLLSNKAIDLSDFDQGLLANSKDNQIIYGIPLGGNYECMIYDSIIIQEAGLVHLPPHGHGMNLLPMLARSLKRLLQRRSMALLILAALWICSKSGCASGAESYIHLTAKWPLLLMMSPLV